MSFIEDVIIRSRRIERLLTELGGEGRGVYEKAASIESLLPIPLRNRLRFVAKVRNAISHDDEFEYRGDHGKFIKECDDAIIDLEAIKVAKVERSQEPTDESKPDATNERSQKYGEANSSSQSQRYFTPFEVVRHSTDVDRYSTNSTSETRPRDVVAALAFVIVVISLGGALFSGGFTTTISHGFDVPHGFWPFNWTERAIQSTDVYNLWFYLCWIGGILFVVSRFLP